MRACSSPSHIPGLGKELKLTKKSIKTEVRGTIKCHYEKNSIVVICWNYNGPVTVISNVHADFLLTTVKRLYYSSRNHININRPYCITNIINVRAELIPLMPWSVFIELMYLIRNGTGPITSALLMYIKVRPSKFSSWSIQMQK